MKRVMVLSGPNLARLGVREPDIYGADSYDDLVVAVHRWCGSLGLDPVVRQSDSETEMVTWLHDAVDAGSDVVINPAAFTHYSYSLRDAAAQVTSAGLALIEVHLSNPATREAFRHRSTISAVATGTIAGFGFDSYRLALEYVARR